MPQILTIFLGQFHKLLSPLKKEEDDHDQNTCNSVLLLVYELTQTLTSDYITKT